MLWPRGPGSWCTRVPQICAAPELPEVLGHIPTAAGSQSSWKSDFPRHVKPRGTHSWKKLAPSTGTAGMEWREQLSQHSQRCPSPTHVLVHGLRDELSLAVDAGVGSLAGDLLLLLGNAARRGRAAPGVQRACNRDRQVKEGTFPSKPCRNRCSSAHGAPGDAAGFELRRTGRS